METYARGGLAVLAVIALLLIFCAAVYRLFSIPRRLRELHQRLADSDRQLRTLLREAEAGRTLGEAQSPDEPSQASESKA